MRSTRGKSRASKPHFTSGARVTSPRHSTERSPYGNHELPAGVATGSGTRHDFADRNSNSRLKDGGISSFYRSREIGYRA